MTTHYTSISPTTRKKQAKDGSERKDDKKFTSHQQILHSLILFRGGLYILSMRNAVPFPHFVPRGRGMPPAY